MNTQSNIVSIENVVALVLRHFGEQMGAGQIAKATNAACELLNVEKDGELYQVTQNMMTNYGKNGTFDAQKRESMAGVTFAQSDVAAWLTKFLNKRVNGIVVSSSRGIDPKAIVASVREELNQLQQIEEQDDEIEIEDQDDDNE